MPTLIALSLIFLSGCGIVHIEVRDKTPKAQQREDQIPKQKEEIKPSPRENTKTPIQVSMPVRGKPTRTERGYYISTPCGEFFRSISDGRVLYAGDDIRNYRWVVMVEGLDGLVYVYGMADSLMVKRGEKVRKGQPLGKVGNNRDSCGLIFEVRDSEGKPINFEFVL
ncbi:MAG: murein hydrolase activator EnvC family protein [Aquificaceae bacterium]